MASVEERVKTIIVDQLGLDPDRSIDNESSYEDLGGDSLDAIEMIMAFEDEFSIEIDDVLAEKLTTVQKAIDYLEKVGQ